MRRRSSREYLHHEGPWSRKLPTWQRRELFEARHAGLELSDYLRTYQDRSAQCQDWEPSPEEADAIYEIKGDSRDPEAVAAAIGREAERIRTEGFDRALFERLKKSALGRRMRDLDSFESICYRICAYYFEGVEYFRFPEAYAAITPEEVAQFLSETLRPERACLTTVVPKEESYV